MTLRSVLGYGLFCWGAVSVAFAGGRYAMGAWRQQELRRSWTEFEARAVIALARREATTTGLRPLPVAPGVPVARIRIPSIQLDEIVVEGVDTYSLNAGPGHLPGSAFPGEQGNAVISAHRDRHFSHLGMVEVGDTVVTESGSRTTRWLVVSKRVIAADDPAIFRSDDATLTLTTCWPIRYFGPAPERLLLTAKRVGSESRGGEYARESRQG